MNNMVKLFIGTGILCITIIYIIFGPIYLVRSIINVTEYSKNKNSTVTITANISKIESTTDTEGGIDYDIYVSYTYNGKSYNNVYWRETAWENDYSIGAPATITISTNKPGEIFHNATYNYSNLILSLMFTLFGAFVGYSSIRAIYNP